RYDTPAIAGFTASVSWGEDDRWGGALRYSQDWNGLAVEAGIGYDNNTDEQGPGGEVETYLASLSLYHSATGLFGVVSYGEQDRNIVGIDNATNWYGKLG